MVRYSPEQQIYLDPAIRNWVLIPIMLVMVLVGIVRHYVTKALKSQPKNNILALRESAALLRSRLLRSKASSLICKSSFNYRRDMLCTAFAEGRYLKTAPPKEGEAAPNPMSDPAAMEGMMGMLKGNIAMIVPQTIIMSWVTFFFSGFVLIKLPFPLTVRFKAMLQRGVETSDMDVRWISSLSWYFLNLFGLSSIYTLILGDSSAASASTAEMGMMGMQQQQQPMQQQNEIINQFKNEKELLELSKHEFLIKDIEKKLLEKYDLIDSSMA